MSGTLGGQAPSAASKPNFPENLSGAYDYATAINHNDRRPNIDAAFSSCRIKPTELAFVFIKAATYSPPQVKRRRDGGKQQWKDQEQDLYDSRSYRALFWERRTAGEQLRTSAMSRSALVEEGIRCEYRSVSRHRVSPHTVMDVILHLKLLQPGQARQISTCACRPSSTLAKKPCSDPPTESDTCNSLVHMGQRL